MTSRQLRDSFAEFSGDLAEPGVVESCDDQPGDKFFVVAE
jgi:hypothetical protein